MNGAAPAGSSALAAFSVADMLARVPKKALQSASSRVRFWPSSTSPSQDSMSVWKPVIRGLASSGSRVRRRRGSSAITSGRVFAARIEILTASRSR